MFLTAFIQVCAKHIHSLWKQCSTKPPEKALQAKQVYEQLLKSTARGDLDDAWGKKTGAVGAQGKLSSVEVLWRNKDLLPLSPGNYLCLYVVRFAHGGFDVLPGPENCHDKDHLGKH